MLIAICISRFQLDRRCRRPVPAYVENGDGGCLPFTVLMIRFTRRRLWWNAGLVQRRDVGVIVRRYVDFRRAQFASIATSDNLRVANMTAESV